MCTTHEHCIYCNSSLAQWSQNATQIPAKMEHTAWCKLVHFFASAPLDLEDLYVKHQVSYKVVMHGLHNYIHIRTSNVKKNTCTCSIRDNYRVSKNIILMCRHNATQLISGTILRSHMPSSAVVQECTINPCQNGGNCTGIVVSTYLCECAPGYSGSLCENEGITTARLHCSMCSVQDKASMGCVCCINLMLLCENEPVQGCT